MFKTDDLRMQNHLESLLVTKKKKQRAKKNKIYFRSTKKTFTFLKLKIKNFNFCSQLGLSHSLE